MAVRSAMIAITLTLFLYGQSEAKTTRSKTARLQFAKETPCPSTLTAHLPCPGYVIDHIIPLCAGGADNPTNMQWQSTSDAKTKDREERRMCAPIR